MIGALGGAAQRKVGAKKRTFWSTKCTDPLRAQNKANTDAKRDARLNAITFLRGLPDQDAILKGQLDGAVRTALGPSMPSSQCSAGA